MAHQSRSAVVAAIAGNGILTALKFGAALLTHSASMMNEAVHSLMDTANQVFLLMGLIRGSRPADRTYAFGHGQKKYLWNLWSAIGLFSIGCGLGLAHAWHSWHAIGEREVPDSISLGGLALDPLWISAVVLLIAFLLEGYVLTVAWREIRRRMAAEGETGLAGYVARAEDPTLVAVFLEDTVAVTGVALAAFGIGMARLTGNVMWDVGFSVAIAVMLGLVAFFLGAVNMRLLTDVRDRDAEEAFRSVIAGLRDVQRYHDLRSVVIDEQHTVLVAEIELAEEVITRELGGRVAYYERALRGLAPAGAGDDPARERRLRTRAVVQASLERAEEVVDEIERRVRQVAPRVFHVTIEVEGIAAPDQPALHGR